MRSETATNVGARRSSVMRLIGASLALLMTFGVVMPVSAVDSVVDVSITVTAGGPPLNGATVSLGANGVEVVASATGDGVYTAGVVVGTYLLSIDPPPDSPYERYEDPAFEVSGTTVTTIALFLPGVDPDPDPPAPDPEPEGPSGTVSGSVRNGLGGAGVGIDVSFVTDDVTVGTTTDADGEYSVVLPPGEWQLTVVRPFSLRPPAGWPSSFSVTYRDPVTVADGDEVTRDVVLSFVDQAVRLLLPDGEPAVGFQATVRVRPTDSEVPSDSEWSSVSTLASSSTATDGLAGVLVLGGPLGSSGYVRADGAGRYRGVQVSSDVVTELLPTAEPIVLQFTESRTLKGQLRDAYGPLRGRVSVRSENGTSGGSVFTESDGTFEVLFPLASGPYVLTGSELVTNPKWRFVTAPLDDELSDIGAVIVPHSRVDLCVVDEVDDRPVNARVVVTMNETQVVDVPVGAGDLTGDFTFSRVLDVATNATTRCTSAILLPDEADVGLRLTPDTYSQYYRTTTTVDTRLGADPVTVRLGRFDQLSDSVAVDVGLRLVNGLGLGLGELPVSLFDSGVTYTRLHVTDQNGRVDTRLARSRYDVREIRGGRTGYPTARGFISAIGGASPDGRYDIRLALGQVPADVSRYDLGAVVLPFVPVDVSVRGSASEPLTGTILETPRVQSCVGVDEVIVEVCASSAYSATTGLRIPGVTNEFGRERLWLVPGVHQLTVTPAATEIVAAEGTGAGYQTRTVTVTVPEGSQGQSVFVVLQDPSGSVDPDPSPQVSVGGPYVVAEGDTVQLAATVLAGSPSQWTWDLDGDGIFETPGQSVTFDASGRPSPSTAGVRVRACDAQARCAEDATSVTILEADSADPDPADPDPADPDPAEPSDPEPVEPDDPDQVESGDPDPADPDPADPDPADPDPAELDGPGVSGPQPTEPPRDGLAATDPTRGTQLPATGSAIGLQVWLVLLAVLSGLVLVRLSHSRQAGASGRR